MVNIFGKNKIICSSYVIAVVIQWESN